MSPWSYATHENHYVNVAETLRRAISTNPHLKVFVANGYYDLATPFFGAENVVAAMNLEPAIRANLRFSYYESGHMLYIDSDSHAKLKRDFTEFVAGALPKEIR